MLVDILNSQLALRTHSTIQMTIKLTFEKPSLDLQKNDGCVGMRIWS